MNMKKSRYIRRTLWTVFVLPPLLAMLFLAAPFALADGMDMSTDAIEIAEDGTVAILSGHMAGERVSSVQFQLRVKDGSASFSFSPELGDRLQYCTEGDGTLDIYIAGTEPLMADGQTRLVVGTVTASPENVEPIQESLQYVYGSRVITLNMPEEEKDGSAEGLMGELQAKLDEVIGTYTGSQRYTEESWGRLNNAIDAARTLLESGSAADEELRGAMEELEAAVNGLVLTGYGALEQALEQAAGVDGSLYTPDSYAAFQAAVDSAKAALAENADSGAMEAAAEALRNAMSRLVEQSSADGSGGVIIDTVDPSLTRAAGGSDAADEPETTAAPSPTANAAAGGAPNTGDASQPGIWMLTVCMCSAALAALVLRRGKSRR